jgi:hypothetical protein
VKSETKPSQQKRDMQNSQCEDEEFKLRTAMISVEEKEMR